MFNVKGISVRPTPSPSWRERRERNNVHIHRNATKRNGLYASNGSGLAGVGFLLSSGIRFVYVSTSPWLKLLAFLVLAVSCFCVSSGKSFLKSLKNVEFHDHEDLIYERIAGELAAKGFCLNLLNVPPRGGEFLHG